jgi:hypothetical protein
VAGGQGDEHRVSPGDVAEGWRKPDGAIHTAPEMRHVLLGDVDALEAKA